MTKAAEKILAEALTLDTRERADVAAKLLASLDGEPEENGSRLARCAARAVGSAG